MKLGWIFQSNILEVIGLPQSDAFFATYPFQMFNVKILTNLPQTALFGNGLVLCLNTFLLCKPIAKKVVAGVQVINDFYIFENGF